MFRCPEGATAVGSIESVALAHEKRATRAFTRQSAPPLSDP
jgi:hypothetical protein